MDPGAFVRNREALVQKYQNANMSPERHASYLRLRALKQRMWRMEDVLTELQALTPASVQVRSDEEWLERQQTQHLTQWLHRASQRKQSAQKEAGDGLSKS